MRPCICEKEGCYLCSLYYNDPRYRALWDGTLQPAKLPSPIKQVANLVSAVATHIAAGLPMVDDAERDHRFAICEGCEFWQNERCLKCGCAVANKPGWLDKLRWKDQKCPIGKW